MDGQKEEDQEDEVKDVGIVAQENRTEESDRLVTEDVEETKFSINKNVIEVIKEEDQADELRALGLTVFDQEVYEKGVIAQVKAFTGESDEPTNVETEEGEICEANNNDNSNEKEPDIIEKRPRDSLSNIEDYLRNQLELQATQKKRIKPKPEGSKEYKSSQFEPDPKKKEKKSAYVGPSLKKKKKKEKLGTRRGYCPRSVSPELQPGESHYLTEEEDAYLPSDSDEELPQPSAPVVALSRKTKKKEKKSRAKLSRSGSSEEAGIKRVKLGSSSGSEYLPTGSESDEVDSPSKKSPRGVSSPKKKRRNYLFFERPDTDDSDWDSDEEFSRKKGNKEFDDGDLDLYCRRLKNYEKSHEETGVESVDGDFVIPKDIWDKLFDYQIRAVKWFWSLDRQLTGGILGDEMGLGKTIQMIAFLAGLHRSALKDEYSRYQGLGPTLIVCPTTVMHQWVREFHTWYPPVRVAILHESGTYQGKDRTQLVHSLHREKYHGVLITSYTGLVQYKDVILPRSWHYVVLDEGHKIRNAKAKVTETAKMLNTPHRLILSGSPLQNNLQEFWCLFDFVCPGRLGTQQVFMETFNVPIMQGGYANASQTQVVTAHKCATILKDTISPYLLRRMKEDVGRNINLPGKKEQVLFCRLSDEQRQLYKDYVETIDVQDMLRGRAKIFVALINMRKICNHPDLYSGGPERNFRISSGTEAPNEYHFGYWKRAGKMIVIESLLKIWSQQGHRVLLFTQSKKMLLLMEDFVKRKKYKYLKLDGQTSVAARQPLIDKFNKDESYFVMLLTTKVGGLGVNLTGANRVVIYDPDWNPATDTQARERAWRIGQQRDVTIYRLITAGTIEEKIYHRQIFKQFLSNKILKDPKQRRFFKSNDLLELFTLSETVKNGTTETAAIFAGTGSEVKIPKKVPMKAKEEPPEEKIVFSESKIEQMKKLAQLLSKKITQNAQSHDKKKVNGDSPPEVKGNEVQLDKCIYGPDGSINFEVAHEVITSTTSSGQNEAQNENHFSKSPSDTRVESETKPPANSEKSPHKHKKRKKEKKRRMETFATMEGQEVPHLVKRRKLKRDKEEERDAYMSQDDYVLKKLFSKGIETVMRHDRIIDGGPSDFALVEAEAERVAQSALKALRDSQSEATPFTSIFKRKRSKECDDLLESIKKRNMVLEAGSSEQSLLSSMVSWLQSQGGTSSTDQMVMAFRNKVGEGKTPLFKALLQKIATFYRAPDKKGYWTIRDEYNNNAPSTSGSRG